MVAGGLAGALYKCTKGVGAAGLGALSGMAIIGGLTVITD